MQKDEKSICTYYNDRDVGVRVVLLIPTQDLILDKSNVTQLRWSPARSYHIILMINDVVIFKFIQVLSQFGKVPWILHHWGRTTLKIMDSSKPSCMKTGQKSMHLLVDVQSLKQELNYYHVWPCATCTLLQPYNKSNRSL